MNDDALIVWRMLLIGKARPGSGLKMHASSSRCTAQRLKAGFGQTQVDSPAEVPIPAEGGWNMYDITLYSTRDPGSRAIGVVETSFPRAASNTASMHHAAPSERRNRLSSAVPAELSSHDHRRLLNSGLLVD